MERDFMGLTLKPTVVKEEFVDGRCEDSGFGRSSGVPWLFPNKVSAFAPVKSDRDDKKQAKHFFGRPAGEASNLPSQLTIFYGGAVTVFDGITPEKAQDILSYAAKGVNPPPAKLYRVPNSGHASPISVSSHPATDDQLIKVETPKIKASAPAMISAVVPLARKASLARFLEKRKERVMNAAPYTMNKAGVERLLAPIAIANESPSKKE